MEKTLKGKTATGFDFEIEEDTLDNWELLKVLRKIDKGEVECTVDAVFLMLGEKQEKLLEEHLKKIEGKVKASSIARELGDIMKSNNDLKNS